MAAPRDPSRVVSRLAERAGLEHRGVSGLWSFLLTLAVETTREAGEFQLPGIGKIVKKLRKARAGRNIRTGERITIPAQEVLQFRFAKTFKDATLVTRPPRKPRPAPVRGHGRRSAA